jgi:hypothetical protein
LSVRAAGFLVMKMWGRGVVLVFGKRWKKGLISVEFFFSMVVCDRWKERSGLLEEEKFNL